MKKRLLILLVLFMNWAFIKAQTNYHSFPDSNAVWNFHLQAYCFSNGQADEHYSITLSGDTIINNQTYQKLSTPYVQSNSTGSCGGTLSGYKGAIREDSANKKVFIIPPTDSTEKLLYDFNLQVGDTVKGYIGNFEPIVQSIDSVLVGSHYRKRWIIDSSYYFVYMIEGIGSTYGLLEEIPPPVTDLADYTLSCFQDDTITYNSVGNCQLITSLSEKQKLKPGLYPNPTSAVIHVKTRQELQRIEVYNLQGQKVQEVNSKKRTWQLPKENGLYLIRLQDEEGNVYTEKVIKN